MGDVRLIEIEARIARRSTERKLIEAAACVANAIACGTGAMIKGSLMERELRDALGLKDGEMVVFR